MVQNNTMIAVTNRGDWMVTYTIPEMHVKRTFSPSECKNIKAEELRALAVKPGGKALIKNYLIIDNRELVDEIIYNVQPEYFYTEKEVVELLLYGSEDQLLDALDFGPRGVHEIIKQKAVELQLNDVRKRNIILEKTGFNVTSAIEVNTQSETVPVEPVARRATPINTSETTEPEAPQRRAAAPRKYQIVKKEEN